MTRRRETPLMMIIDGQTVDVRTVVSQHGDSC